MIDWLTLIKEADIKSEEDAENIKTKMQNNLNKQLLHACSQGNLATAQQAVNRVFGADINCEDGFGYTPIMRAIERNHPTVTAWLLSLPSVNVNCGKGNNGTTLHVACVYSSSDIVRSVAMRTENVNIWDGDGFTPLVRAVDNGNVEGVVGLLPVLGVDWQVRDGSMGWEYGSLLDMAR